MSTSNLSQDAGLRRQQLLEALVAFASACLHREGGQGARRYLQRHYEIDFDGSLPREQGRRDLSTQIESTGEPELPIGIYPSPEAVREYLEDVGFTAEEINDSPAFFDAQMIGRFLLPWRDEQGQIRTLVAIDTASAKDSSDWQLFWRRGTKTEFFGLDQVVATGDSDRHLWVVDDLLEVVSLQARGVTGVVSLGGQGRSWTERHWQRLSELGIRSVTVRATDFPTASSLCEAVLGANRVPGAPIVYIVLGDPSDRNWVWRRLQHRAGSADPMAAWSERIHAQRFVAEELLARHGGGPGTELHHRQELLRDALRYDATAGDTRRALEMERFFWPWLLRVAAIPWQSMQHLRRRHYGDGELWRTDPEQIGRFHQLADALADAAAAANLDRCHRLLQEAMQEVGLDISSHHQERPVYLPPQDCRGAAGTNEMPLPAVAVPSYDERDIELAAYYLWEQRGRPAGHEHQFWAEAEAELRRRDGAQPAGVPRRQLSA